MIQRVAGYIARHRLLDKTKRHLVALSGGADSVCLLLMLKELGYDVHAVHCNFRLRGAESDRDEEFCKELCDGIGVELHLTHFDTRAYAELHKVSIEMAARELRYAYFEQLRVALEAEDIVVAHHRDDNVETLLMNLVRGTGIHGLEAIKPRNGRVIRPLLCISRSEIELFLRQHEQAYVTDSTNLVDDVVRNKIRLNVIPMLESINPAARANICRTIEHVAEAVRMLDDTAEQAIRSITDVRDGRVFLDRRGLLALPSPEYVLFTFLSNYGFTPAQAEQVYANLSAQTGRAWSSATHVIAADRDSLIVEPRTDEEREGKVLVMPESGTYIYKENTKMAVSVSERTEDFSVSKAPLCVTLDADRISFPLTLRRVGQGDRFQPFGMRGSKLVSDYLTDRKRNYFERKRQMVVEDASGRIIWLVGERASQLASCSDDTIKILTLRYITDEE